MGPKRHPIWFTSLEMVCNSEVITNPAARPYQVETPVLQTIWAMCQKLPQADSKPLEALSNWDEEKKCRKNTQTLPTKVWQDYFHLKVSWSVGWCISLKSHKIIKCPINPLLIRKKSHVSSSTSWHLHHEFGLLVMHLEPWSAGGKPAATGVYCSGV